MLNHDAERDDSVNVTHSLQMPGTSSAGCIATVRNIVIVLFRQLTDAVVFTSVISFGIFCICFAKMVRCKGAKLLNDIGRLWR